MKSFNTIAYTSCEIQHGGRHHLVYSLNIYKLREDIY